jgi:glycosidase
METHHCGPAKQLERSGEQHTFPARISSKEFQHKFSGWTCGRFGNGAPDEQVIAAIGYLLCSLGAACIYYGSEQGFSGHGGDNEMREAMFDKATPGRNLLNTNLP